jgi:YYY domain-containing protein
MVDFLIWVITIIVLGLVNFPLSYVLLKHLKDRGYAVTKVLGLLIWGYLFWLLTMLGITGNNLGGVLFALALDIGLNGWLYLHSKADIHQWVKEHLTTIILTEAVFIVFFGFWALVRAADPAIVGTEKPMELAFINAILKSPGFPPNDPWLSGYSISYYYFGYVIVSMLVRITGVSSTVAFNLMVALLFGLVACSAFGLLNNLLAKKFEGDQGKPLSKLWGLIASFFILFLGNVQGFLEMLHARGIGWTQLPDGSWSTKFWTWLNMPEVENPPSLPLQWAPNRSGGYWWWRSSRVIQDFKATGERIEVIDEFPQFTYLLADMHPHVLSMPFVILAITIAMNIYFGVVKNTEEKVGLVDWLWQQIVPSGETQRKKFSDLFISEWLKEPVFWLMTLVCGGIAFFNTWDFPIYVGIFSLSVLVFNTARFGWSRNRITEFLETGILTGILSIVLYIPFFLSFASQAGGFLPSLNFFTRGVYFWIMFGTLLVPLLIWLIWMVVKNWQTFHVKVGGWGAGGLVFGFWLFSYLVAAGFLLIVPLTNSESLNSLASRFYWLQGGTDSTSMLTGSLVSRLMDPLTWITILLGLFLVWGLLFDKPNIKTNALSKKTTGFHVDRFVIILALLGFGLTLVPEYLYLLDQFGWRMNTIFKFYFQTWILWSIAAGYGTVMVWKKMKGAAGIFGKLASIVMILVGLAFPVFGIWEITHNFKPQVYDETGNILPDWNLDGATWRERYQPDEMEAIYWLRDQPIGVVAEAVGGAYSDYARVSTYSGQPTVLGWANHESQWRGGYEEIGSREADMEMLYRSGLWEPVKAVLDEYEITYVFFGKLEVEQYNANNKLFEAHLTRLFVAGDVVVYGYTPEE